MDRALLLVGTAPSYWSKGAAAALHPGGGNLPTGNSCTQTHLADSLSNGKGRIFCKYFPSFQSFSLTKFSTELGKMLLMQNNQRENWTGRKPVGAKILILTTKPSSLSHTSAGFTQRNFLLGFRDGH